MASCQRIAFLAVHEKKAAAPAQQHFKPGTQPPVIAAPGRLPRLLLKLFVHPIAGVAEWAKTQMVSAFLPAAVPAVPLNDDTMIVPLSLVRASELKARW